MTGMVLPVHEPLTAATESALRAATGDWKQDEHLTRGSQLWADQRPMTQRPGKD